MKKSQDSESEEMRITDYASPYMPFPAFWPKFAPKDKLGDWFETYASTLELNAWLSTTA